MADETTGDNSTDAGTNANAGTESAEQKDVDTKSGNSGSTDNSEAVTTALKGVTDTLASLGTMIKEIPAAVASAVNISDKDSPESKQTEGTPGKDDKQDKPDEPKYEQRKMHANTRVARWWHGSK